MISVRLAPLILFAALLIMFSGASLKRNHLLADLIAFYTDVSVKSPQKGRGSNNLGSLFMSAGQYDKAIPPLLLSVRADPWYVEPHLNLAICYIKKKSFDQAVPELEEVIRINSILKKGHYGQQLVEKYTMQAHSNLGNIYYVKGMFDKAISHYKEALKISPEDASSHFNLAMAYETIGMFKEAGAEFEETLRIDPADEGARRGVDRLNRFLPENFPSPGSFPKEGKG